jgi:peptide deformylase
MRVAGLGFASGRTLQWPCLRLAAAGRQVLSLYTPCRPCSSSSNTQTHSNSDGHRPQDSKRDAGSAPVVQFPIVQLPARSLLSRQTPLSIRELKAGEYKHMIDRLVQSRKYYQYPSLSAPQIGWNVRVFTLYDGSVWVNPKIVEVNCVVPEGTEVEPGVLSATSEDANVGAGAECTPYRSVRKQPAANCWAWEPCASCAFLMHFIERPGTCRMRGYNEHGEEVERVMDGMRARFAQHEVDHLDGVLFTRRIPNTDHVVLADGFSGMSDWSDDFPSLEARSTFLYTTFTPPYTFLTEGVHDAYLLDRKFEDGIYPGHEMDRQQRVEDLAFEELKRAQWRRMKEKMHEEDVSAPHADAPR